MNYIHLLIRTDNEIEIGDFTSCVVIAQNGLHARQIASRLDRAFYYNKTTSKCLGTTDLTCEIVHTEQR